MKKFVPDQVGAGIKKKDETTIISLLCRLARSGDFDDEGRIRGQDGSFIDGTNVAQLCALAFRAEPHVNGVAEFALLLRKLGVTDVPNENLKTHIEPFARSSSLRGRSTTPLARTLPLTEHNRRSPSPQDIPLPPNSPLPQDVPLPPDSPLPQDVPLPSDDSVPQKRKSGWQGAGPVPKRGRGNGPTRRSSRLVPPPSPPLPDSGSMASSVPQKRSASSKWQAYQPPEKKGAMQKAVRRSERNKKK